MLVPGACGPSLLLVRYHCCKDRTLSPSPTIESRETISSYGSSDSIPVVVVVIFVFVVLFYHAEGGGSGQDRTTPSWIVADVVTGAEVRRISIGFEPEIGGRPKTA